MRNLLLILTALFFSFPTLAQKNKKKAVPEFGKVEKAELELKDCDFDKNAEAMVMFHVGQMTFLRDVELTNHVRIKILNDKGKTQADIRIVYHSFGGDEDVRDIVAQTYNLDASGNIVVSKLDKKSIYEKKLNKHFTEKVFSFPDVKEGSILEYKYKLTGAPLVNWYFQRDIPVKYSEFILDFPSEIEILSTPHCTLTFDNDKEYESTRTVEYFSMKDIPAFRQEPYMLNEEDYLERIETRLLALNYDYQRISLTTTWPKIIKNLMDDEDFGTQLKKEIPRTADLDEQLSKISDPYERMRTIHEYVRKNMTWNGYSGIWAFDGVKNAWKDKKGTSGEINLILNNLLKNAGLKSYPILVSTHSNGLVNTADPGINQFDKVMAYVEIGDNVYVLDATEKNTPTNLIPQEVLLTEGLVLEKIAATDASITQTVATEISVNSNWGWKTLWNEKTKYKNVILILGTINENGKMQGEVSINSYDYARIKRSNTAKKGVKDFTETYLTTDNPGIQVDSVSFNNLDADSLPLIQKIYFNQPLNSSGDYRYFSSNIFTGLEKNPFIADERFSDVFFGANQYYTIIGSFNIPDNYVIEELPKNTKMIMPDTSISITRMAQVDANSISVRYTLEFRKPFFEVGQYPEFREFYKKLQDLMNEQFVIRKKS
jgi:hypothetical protein